MKRVSALLKDPKFAAKFHGWSALAWLTVGTGGSILLRESIVWLVFLSVYAIVVSHWEAWQTSQAQKDE